MIEVGAAGVAEGMLGFDLEAEVPSEVATISAIHNISIRG